MPANSRQPGQSTANRHTGKPAKPRAHPEPARDRSCHGHVTRTRLAAENCNSPHEMWNFWIVYPLGAWLLIVAAHAWAVFGNKPISESEIKREIERQAGPRR